MLLNVFQLVLLLCGGSYSEGHLYHYSGKAPPSRFMWGVATSAFEIEGAPAADGKGPSVWDGAMSDSGDGGPISCDSYHHYKEDVQMLRNLGVHHYRFSISWSRVLPRGTLEVINMPGIRYYLNLIDELTKYGITPFVTLYHFDLPQALEDHGGWLNSSITEHFNDYADLCFRYFGHKVKHWVTVNEPGLYSKMAYEFGVMEPRIRGNGTLVYQSAHNMLLSHARAYRTYQRRYKKRQGGQVGIALEIFWPEPKNPNDAKDRLAAQIALDFEFGWFADPLIRTGDYPEIMKYRIGENSERQKLGRSRLPELRVEDQKLVLGAYDFIGLNMYSSHLVNHRHYNKQRPSLVSDRDIELSVSPDWQRVLPWLSVTPWGLRKSLMYIKQAYNNPTVYILENGIGDTNGTMKDEHRILYHSQYIHEMLRAIHEGCDVRAYTAWTLMDSFNFIAGYKIRFGFYSVDFTDPGRKRTPKLSAEWYSSFIRSRSYLTPRTQARPEVGFSTTSAGHTSVKNTFYLILINALIVVIHQCR